MNSQRPFSISTSAKRLPSGKLQKNARRGTPSITMNVFIGLGWKRAGWRTCGQAPTGSCGSGEQLRRLRNLPASTRVDDGFQQLGHGERLAKKRPDIKPIQVIDGRLFTATTCDNKSDIAVLRPKARHQFRAAQTGELRSVRTIERVSRCPVGILSPSIPSRLEIT